MAKQNVPKKDKMAHKQRASLTSSPLQSQFNAPQDGGDDTSLDSAREINNEPHVPTKEASSKPVAKKQNINSKSLQKISTGQSAPHSSTPTPKQHDPSPSQEIDNIIESNPPSLKEIEKSTNPTSIIAESSNKAPSPAEQDAQCIQHDTRKHSLPSAGPPSLFKLNRVAFVPQTLRRRQSDHVQTPGRRSMPQTPGFNQDSYAKKNELLSIMSAITIALNPFCKLYKAINDTVKDQQVTQALILTKVLHLEGYITAKEDNNINKEMIKQVTSKLMDKLKPTINTSLESKNANGCNTKNSSTQTKTLIDLTFNNNQSEQSKLLTHRTSPNNKSSDPQKTPTQRKDSNNKTTSSHLVTAEQQKKEVEKVVLVLNKPTITNKINNEVPETSYAIFKSHNLKEPTNILVTKAKHQRLISNRQLESATATASKRHGATSEFSKKESHEGPGTAALADTNLTNSPSEAIISVDNSDLDETLMNLSVHPYDDSNHPSTPLLSKQTKSQNHCSVFEASPKRTNKDNNTAKEHKERDFETLEDKHTRLLNKMQMREHRNSQGQNNNHSQERPSKKEERQAVSNNTDERHKHSNEERRKAQQTRERSRSRNHTPKPNKQHQDSKEKHHHESHHRHSARLLTKPQSEVLHLQQNTGRRPSKRRT
ncbi:peptidyl-prolyl cis-trans isomerase G-like [Ambystoma mexicanum]|uniref:peptidyl-prolyl cis-trans isomerase G-like n=1 Tax=Ambystoma mexicanum TaxID=8296 RepID=UPI0037E8ABDD